MNISEVLKQIAKALGLCKEWINGREKTNLDSRCIFHTYINIDI